MAQALPAVHQRGGEVVARHGGLGRGMDEAGARPLHVLRQHPDAVGVHPPQIGADHEIGGDAGVLGRHPERFQHRDDVGGERRR
jgi:hypothetical protein